MTWHLINKAVVKKNCVEALNQHAQPLEKKATFARLTWNIGNPSTKTTEKRNSWTINRAECFHRNWLKYNNDFQAHSDKPLIYVIIIIIISIIINAAPHMSAGFHVLIVFDTQTNHQDELAVTLCQT